jgi:hypothetical protein
MRGRLRKSVIAVTGLIIVAGTTVADPNSAVTERNPATGVDYARLSLLVRWRTNVATMLQSARL